ncbi:MAG: hypothetical protein IJ528_02375 [Bacteroidaceae bacterium]|nr:hypothetical protein [Bacteroidaceae bacterium]
MKAEQKGRYITPEHVEAYKNGVFKTLLEAIKEDPELSLEMRLNNEAKVYYHKDKILTTSINSNGEKKVTMLDKKYYDKYPDKERPSADIENIKKLRSITLIRKYFRDAKKLTYFYKKGTEFSFQQNIALGNRSFDNKYLVVDMEWQFSQEGIEENERISRTRIDLVIIDTEKNEHGCNDIYLAELKVGTEATDGKSGIIDHVNKTYEIIQKKEACVSLVNDVKSIIDNKTELGLISGQPKDFNFGDKPKMMIISAYRGKEEKQRLDDEMQKAIKRAKEIGMEAPKCILYNALIQLKD